MGRGEGNILFGRPLLIKKEADCFSLFQEKFFPATPRKMVPTTQGVFLLDEGNKIYSLDQEGREIESFKPFTLDHAARGMGKTSLVSYATAWLREDGSLFYKTIYPDLALDSQGVSCDTIEEDIVSLQVAQGNGLFLITEGKDENGRTRSRVMRSRIDPTSPLSQNSWESVLPDSQTVHGIIPSPEGLWIFSVSEKGERRPRIDWLPTKGEKKSWLFLDWRYDDFFASQRLLFWKDNLLYKKDNTVIGLDLNDKYGHKKIFCSVSGQIHDFALSGDLLVVREEKTLSLIHLSGQKEPVQMDLDDQQTQLLLKGEDLLLWQEGEKSYLYFPDFLRE